HATFEEIVYLLWHRKLPNKEELATLTKQLAEHADIPQQIIDHFKMYPLDQVHPMAALRTAISFLGLYDEEAEAMNPEANYRKAIRL
ncbi:citrate/2-methylcitrate synthase, partial [Salmonella enterica]|uniref:citrate/2-methylcitrate synthase n=1 Tax=Salmonella enterica TaxID=28901 RepID=UPI003CEF44C2